MNPRPRFEAEEENLHLLCNCVRSTLGSQEVFNIPRMSCNPPPHPPFKFHFDLRPQETSERRPWRIRERNQQVSDHVTTRQSRDSGK